MKMNKLELGTKFYIFESEDEYRILYLVKKNEHDGIFMDEETFETKTIDENQLGVDYTLMLDSKNFFFARFKHCFDKKQILWFCNNDIITFAKEDPNFKMFDLDCCVKVILYKYMKKSVLNHLINNIIKLNYLFNITIDDSDITVDDSDIDVIWNEYFINYLKNDTIVVDYNPYLEEVDMDKVAKEEAQIPDSVIDDAEKLLNTFIAYYQVYEYDNSIDLDKINMHYYMAYQNDTYYLVLYGIDKARQAAYDAEVIRINSDVAAFMLK